MSSGRPALTGRAGGAALGSSGSSATSAGERCSSTLSPSSPSLFDRSPQRSIHLTTEAELQQQKAELQRQQSCV